MNDHDPAVLAWIDEARFRSPVEVAEQLGIKLRRIGRDFVASCPVCGGRTKNEFVCTPSNPDPKNRWLCRKSGTGGNPIQMWRHVTGDSFRMAVAAISGRLAPDGQTGRPEDPSERLERQRRQEREQTARLEMERSQKEKKMQSAREIFEAASPIRGTHAEAYLGNRSITLAHGQDVDLRFFPDLAYYGYADEETEELSRLGSYPAMLAAIRDVSGAMIGIHRTYLERDRAIKLSPPGDQRRNKAKKISGNSKGGLIRLGPITDYIIIGEGIETTLAFGLLDVVQGDYSLAAGISLGNMSGGSASSIPHPLAGRGDVPAGAKIPSGEPDLQEPGMEMPSNVTSMLLLGDGDSDAPMTYARLRCAKRRFEAKGIEVSICMADPGEDFASMLEKRVSTEVAA